METKYTVYHFSSDGICYTYHEGKDKEEAILYYEACLEMYRGRKQPIKVYLVETKLLKRFEED